jgi:phosphohistidine swiveling domain-containing protein
MSYIRWFHEVGVADVGLAGGKGANLGEMASAGLPVPPGFCLTAAAYREFIQATGVDESIRSILTETRLDEPADVEAKSAHIRSLIVEQQVPSMMAQQVLDAYHRLGQELRAPDATQLPVAVRSSATAEDLPTASFAGQQETYLNVCGGEDLLERTKHCWASLWTARAVTYRARQGFDQHGVYLAVVVQAMIPSEVSGILFTANPITGNRDEAVINASWGLGEAVVSSLVTPDTFTVRKSDGNIESRQIGTKERMIQCTEDGRTVELATPAEQRDAPALSDEQVAELVGLACEIEAHYGAPQDIEWAYASGRLFILQSRAITTLAPPRDAAEEVEYNRTMFAEIFPEALSPAFLSAIQPLIHSFLDFTLEALGFEPPQGMEAVRVFYHQPYLSLNYIAAALRPLSPAVRGLLVGTITNPFGRHQQKLQGELSLTFLRMVARLLRLLRSFADQVPELIARYRAEVAEVVALPLETVCDEEIVVHIRELVFGTVSRLMSYDRLMIALVGVTNQMLSSLLQRHFGEETEAIRAKLISGVTGNVTMETNKHLCDLAQLAKASPTVSDLLRRYSEREVRTHLQHTPQGRAFLDELERFLSEYGHREIRMDILYPTWGEDPSLVFSFVRGYLDADEAQSPHRQQARLVRQRQELTEAVQARLEQDVAGRYLLWPIFRWVLRYTQVHLSERETMHFELTRIFPPFRRLLLDLGRRWSTRGLIARTDDVFFLSLDEMQEVAASPCSMHNVVRARRSEFEADKQRHWPDIIRGGQEIYAEGAEPDEGTEGQLHGLAGSPGVVTGVARVIRGPEEFGKLQVGEILVAPLTNPVWTPLFAIASAVVTEVGGILSHGVIVAREYGIPAVTGVAGATKLVQEGQMMTVDGSQGIVYLEMGEAAC